MNNSNSNIDQQLSPQWGKNPGFNSPCEALRL